MCWVIVIIIIGDFGQVVVMGKQDEVVWLSR